MGFWFWSNRSEIRTELEAPVLWWCCLGQVASMLAKHFVLRAKIWPLKCIQSIWWPRLLSVLRWLLYCRVYSLFVVAPIVCVCVCMRVRTYARACVCARVCVFGGVLVMWCGSCSRFLSSCWGRESWLLYFNCLVITVFCFSSLECHGLVCSPLMWHFLVMLISLYLMSRLQLGVVVMLKL